MRLHIIGYHIVILYLKTYNVKYLVQFT